MAPPLVAVFPSNVHDVTTMLPAMSAKHAAPPPPVPYRPQASSLTVLMAAALPVKVDSEILAPEEALEMERAPAAEAELLAKLGAARKGGRQPGRGRDGDRRGSV